VTRWKGSLKTMLSSRRRRRNAHCFNAVVMVLLCLAGCRGGPVFQANRLPPEWVAPRVSSLSSLDLSRISRSVGNSEILYPGDVVKVTITTGVEDETPIGTELRITENGVCSIPLIGPVQIAGLPLTQAEGRVREEGIRRGKFINPSVSIIVETRRSNRVTVVGAVEKPGTHELPASQSDLLGALMMAGGTTEDAGTIIEVRHPPEIHGPPTQFSSYSGGTQPVGAPQVMRVDLQQVTAQGGGDYRIYDGSTVMVMKKPQRFIHVMGLVNTPDQFEIPDDTELTLLQAISMAGGLKLELADKVHVMRRNPRTGELRVINASIRKAKTDGVSNIRLAANDVVSVEETATTLIIGTIRDFVRFGFTSGIPGI
jgi:polysaccharide export outer membrane protein